VEKNPEQQKQSNAGLKYSRMRSGKPKITMNENTAALAESARRGDIRAFEQLVKNYMKKAYFITLGLVGNSEDALDISQNAFVKAYRGIKTLKSGERFVSWFYSILRNEAVNYLKKAGNRRFITLDDPLQIVQITASEGVDPERAELCRAVWQAIRTLPLEMQEVLIMQQFQGMDYNEISGLLGIPRGSVASRLYRAREALRRKLDGFI